MPKETLAVGVDARGAVVGASQYNGAVSSMTATNATAQTGMMGLKSAFLGLFAVIGGTVAFQKVTSLTADFGEVLAQVRGVTNSTTEQMNELESVARRLGATTRHTATQAGEGFLNLSRAGFEVDESMVMIEDTLTLATAGVLDLGDASEITANTIRQFKLDVQDTQRVADVFVNTANSANTNVQELADGMSYAGPIAGNLGVSMEETAGSIGVLSNAGLKGSRAGAGLRMVLTKLVNPTKKARDTLNQMGLTLDDVNPEKVGLTGAVEALAEANLTASQSARIFGTRQAVTGLVLADNVDAVKELTEANRESLGTSERMADIMRKTLTGALLELKSTLQETALIIGDRFGSAMKSAVKFATAFIRELAGISVEGGKASTTVKALAGATEVFLKSMVLLTALSLPLMIKKLATSFIALKSAIVATNSALATLLIPAVLVFATAYASIKFGQWLAEFAPVAKGMQHMILGVKTGFELLKATGKIVWVALAETAKKFAINPLIKGFIWMHNKIGEAVGGLLKQAVKVMDKISNVSGPYYEEVRKLRGQIIVLSRAYENKGLKAEDALYKEKNLTSEVLRITKEATDAIQDGIDVRDRAIKKIEEQAKAGEVSNQRNAVTDMMQGAYDKAKQLTKQMLGFNGAVDASKMSLEEAKTVLDEMKTSAQTMWKDFKSSLAPAIKPFKEMANSTKKLFGGVSGAVKKAGEESKRFKMTWDDIKGTVASSFADLITTGKDLRSMVAGLANQLTRMAIQRAIMSMGTGGGGAGSVPGMATGGVVTAPTVAMIGEKGEEAVMPLAKDSSGNLGVKAEGGSGGMTVNIVSPDAVGIEKMLLENPRLLQQMEQTKMQGYNL